MSYEIPYRGVLTDALVDYFDTDYDLKSAAILVGDGLVKPGAGWNGTPGKSDYLRSLLVITGIATPASQDPISSRHTSWLCRYTLLLVGGSRTQADHGADLVRSKAVGFPATLEDRRLTMGPHDWKVLECYFEAFAPVAPDQRSTPPTWLVRDELVLRLARTRT